MVSRSPVLLLLFRLYGSGGNRTFEGGHNRHGSVRRARAGDIPVHRFPLSHGGWARVRSDDSVLGGALGLPQSKYSGLTAGLGAAGGFGLGSLAAGSSIMAGTSLATGAALGSVVPVVGTVLGAIGGGLLGSLFGGGRRTHASVYGKMEDVGFSRDQQTYIDAFMGGAWYDRAGKSEAEPLRAGDCPRRQPDRREPSGYCRGIA